MQTETPTETLNINIDCTDKHSGKTQSRLNNKTQKQRPTLKHNKHLFESLQSERTN